MAETPTTPDPGWPLGKRGERLIREAEARGPTPLARLASWAAELSAPDFIAGEVVPGKRGEDGVSTLAWWADSRTVARFHDYCYADGWVRPDRNWVEWAKTERGKALLAGPAASATAHESELAKLLTTILRANRFTEGYMGTKFADGTMLAICRRAAELAGGKR